MGRSLRRRLARQNRIEEKKDNPSVSLGLDDVRKMKSELTEKAVTHSIQWLMTCFALALNHTEGYGRKRCLRVLEEVERLMVMINVDEVTIDDLIGELKDRVGIEVKL